MADWWNALDLHTDTLELKMYIFLVPAQSVMSWICIPHFLVTFFLAWWLKNFLMLIFPMFLATTRLWDMASTSWWDMLSIVNCAMHWKNRFNHHNMSVFSFQNPAAQIVDLWLPFTPRQWHLGSFRGRSCWNLLRVTIASEGWCKLSANLVFFQYDHRSTGEKAEVQYDGFIVYISCIF